MVHETAVREVYSYEEVLQSSRDYFKQHELAATTWINKYALKNKDGLFLEKNPDDMHKRMAKQFAKIEARYKPAVEARDELSKYGQSRKALKEKENEKAKLKKWNGLIIWTLPAHGIRYISCFLG